MSFSSTRFLSAFSWSFLLVSNSRLSGATRSGRHNVGGGLKPIYITPSFTFLSIRHFTIDQRREDTDFKVGVVSRPVRVWVSRAEGSGGQRHEHGAHPPHGQQRSAERCSPGNTTQDEKHATSSEIEQEFVLDPQTVTLEHVFM